MSTLTITAPIALINASGLATAIHSSFCARVGSITTRESGRHNADASAAEAALTANMEKAAIVTETRPTNRSEEHTSELQSLMRISYAVFCLKKKKNKK